MIRMDDRDIGNSRIGTGKLNLELPDSQLMKNELH